MIRRKTFTCLGCLFGILVFLESCHFKQSSPDIPRQQPNILFLFADDQRYNTLGVLGNEEIITPNLDRLVLGGTSFTNTYIMGAMNGAVCAPSRAMLMTGRGVFDIIPADANNVNMPDTLLPRALASNGYQTFHTGKWHNGKNAFTKAFDDGAKIFFGGMSDQYAVPTHEFSSEGVYDDSLISTTDIHSSEIYAGAAIEYIQKVEVEKGPFMMYVAFQAPHDPRDVAQKYIDRYDTAKIALPPNFIAEHPFDNGELDIRDEWLAGYPRTGPEVKANIIAYYAMITHLDEQIGHILQALEDKGLRENTLIVFSADNGLALGQHGLMGKQNLYEHSIKVPLIFQGPGIPKNVQKEAFTYLTDLYPTLCELTQTRIPSLVEGESLVPVLTGERTIHRNSMIYAYKSNQRAFREGDFKLIKYMVEGNSKTQLFNINNDPWEVDNLSEQEEYQGLLVELEGKLQKQLSQEGDDAHLDEPNWGIEVLPRWVDKVSEETLSWLRELAKRERKLRGF